MRDSVTSIGEYAFYLYSFYSYLYCEASSEPSGWDSSWVSSDSYVYYYSETEPTTTGNYWHYVNGVPTIW